METKSLDPVKQASLQRFIFSAILGAFLLTFGLVYLATTLLYHQAYTRQANALTLGLSEQISQSLQQLMEKGWSRKELFTFLDPVIRANVEVPVGVAIYRAASVTDQFGAIDAVMRDERVRQVMSSGESFSAVEDDLVRRVVAVKAEADCLSCHSNTQVGSVLGVVEISQDLRATAAALQRKFLLVFVLLAPVPVLMAWLASRRMSARVTRATTLLHDEIRKVNSVDDLTVLQLRANPSDFAEFNQILAEFNGFAGKMREVAIDKDLLAFEVNLLETFIITSEVVKDWRDHVGRLLSQVNQIMDAYVLFSIFDSGNESYDLEIFWRSRPSVATRNYFDQVVHQRLLEHRRLKPLADIKTRHNIVNFEAPEMTIAEQDLDLQTKSVILENPQIGGVVGLGVHSGLKANEGKSLIIESILTTLLNVIGSVKAIYTYTKELEYYATRDPLTNLYNQRVFWDMAENERQRARSQGYSFGLLVVDLDNFKMLNDRYGHAFGDNYLKLLAGKIREALPASDILTRYGGDEFAVILPEADAGRAYETALKVIEAVKQTSLRAPDEKTIRATASVGLAAFPEHSGELNTLFVIANNMMYKAKTEGKNRIGVPSREDIHDVLKATEEKTLFLLSVLDHPDRVVPFFQPIMAVADEAIEIHELLMGIEHEGAILPASKFIDMAEGMGIVSQLDYINMEKAFREIRRTSYQGLLFINLSPKSLILSEFLPRVRALARRYGVASEQIVFEITERETVKNPALLDKFVTDLKQEGFKFAIDDFGAGFSTFNYIKMFPVDYIKIEGDFIRNAPKDPTDRAFVKCIVSLAKDLRIQTIAETIEDEAMLEAVRELGADFAQGYHIRPPGRELT